MSTRAGPRTGPAPELPPRAIDRHGMRREALRQRALLREKRAAGAGTLGGGAGAGAGAGAHGRAAQRRSRSRPVKGNSSRIRQTTRPSSS